MNVVYDTTIVGQIREAIMTAAADNRALACIEISESEMKDFLACPEFKDSATNDRYYPADRGVSVPRGIARVKSEADVPEYCYYDGVLIQVV